MIGKMFSTPRPKRFSITTRYYDEEKEKREARKRQIKAELGIKDENEKHIPNIKGQFRANMTYASKTASAERKKSTRRFFIIFLVLCLIAYAYLKLSFLNTAL